MEDWAKLLFFVFLIAGAYLGLRQLARPRRKTQAEFERSAAEGSTALGASMNALQELMNPEAAKSKEVQVQMKEGRFNKRSQAEGPEDTGEEGETGADVALKH